MKTSTAFAILAVLAASANAIPISRRDGPECPCELLDPNNAVKNVHTVHHDNADLLPDQLRDDEVLDNPETATFGSAQAESTPAETESVADSEDGETESFNRPKTAFRLSRPMRPAAASTEDAPAADDNGLMSGADINSIPSSGDDDVQDGGDAIVPGATTQDKVNKVEESVLGDNTVSSGSEDEADEGIQALGLEGPVNGVAPGERTGDRVDGIVDPVTSGGGDNNGSDPITQTSTEVNDAVAKHTGGSTNDHVDNITSRPVEHVGETVSPISDTNVKPTTDGPVSSAPEVLIPGSAPTVNNAVHGPVSTTADNIVPGTGSRVNTAADGPTSHIVDGVVPGSGPAVQHATNQPVDQTANQALSGDTQVLDHLNGNSADPSLPVALPSSGNLLAGMPDIDMNVSVRPQGQTASSQSQSASSGPAQEESGSSNPIPLQPIAGSLTRPLMGQVQDGQLGNSVRPVGASILGGVPSNLLANGNAAPLGAAINNVRPGQTQQLTGPVSDSARPLTSGGGLANIVSGGNGLPLINTVARPQGNPIGANSVNGAPIISSLRQSQGSPVNTNQVNGLPVINTLAQPAANRPASSDSLVDEGDSTFRGTGRLFASKVRPTVDNVNGDVEEAPDSLDNGPDGVIDAAVDDLAKEDVEACRDCAEKAIDPATSRLSDGTDLVESDPLDMEPTVEPATSRVASAGDVAQSDPLRVEPFVEDPNSELPVSYECATSPLSNMPVNTMPCLTNWGGRIGEDVDMCINQDQLEFRPDYTMACPEEMQDDIVNDFGLLRREDNDQEWDMLNRDVVQQYVRLCLISNGL